MKQDSLQSLLDKYREGTLTEGERAELERLSHKEEVMAAADRRVSGIFRRRVALAMSALIIVGAGVAAVMPRGGEEPLVAAVQEVPELQEAVEMQEATAPAEAEEAAPVLVAEARPEAMSRRTQQAPEAQPAVKAKKEPVVVCNNQCDADSVISDIRKFLSV